MSTVEKKNRVRDGLPHCIAIDPDGFERLKAKLGLNRDSCKRLIESAKKQVAAFPTRKPSSRLSSSDRDPLLLFDLYQDKNRRYDHWAAVFSRVESGDEKGLGGRLPSLEHGVLVQYLNDYDFSTPDSKRCAEVFAEWPDLVQHLKDRVTSADFVARVWSDTRDRLSINSWNSLTPDQRTDLTLVVFAVATIVDDERIFRAAINDVPDLATEFRNLLDATENSATAPIEDVLVRWSGLCESLQTLSARAGGSPPVVDVLPQIKGVVDDLVAIARLVNERCVSMVFDQLPSRVEDFLHDIEGDPEFSWLGETERNQVRARWQQAQQSLSIDQIRDELDRLNEEVPPAIGAVRDHAAKLSDAVAQHDSLSAQAPPDSLAARHRQEELIEDAEKSIHALRRKQRQAQRQVLSGLCPLAAAFDMGPPDTGPLPSQDSLPKKTESASVQPESPSTLPTETSDAELPDSLSIPATSTTEVAPPAEHRSHEPPDGASEVPTTIHDDSIHDEPIPKTEVAQIDDVFEPILPSPPPLVGQIESHDQAKEDPLTTHAIDRIAEALKETPPRLAYAVQVGRLLTQLNMDSDQPPIAILEAATLSDRLTEPDGAIASEMKSILARFPSPDSLAHTDDARDLYVVLALAATLRPTLLSPHTGAYSVLAAVQPSERLAAVFQLTQAISGASRSLQSVRIDSTVLETATSQTAWQEHRDRLVAEAEAWRRNAVHMTMKYAPATVVWQRWLKPDGPIARMMELITSCTAETEFITRTRDHLTNKKDVRTLVRTTDRQEIGRQAGKDIHAGALDQLYDHGRRAADFADRYLNLLRSRPSQSSFITQTLTSLRHHVTHLGPPACDQLQDLMSSSTSPLLAGAASTGIYAIARFRKLFEIVPDNEPHPKALIGSALLHFPAIPVNSDGLPDGDLRQALDTLVSTPPETLRTSFHRRLGMEDFAISRWIIDWIETNEDDDTQDLRECWDRAVGSERRNLRNDIDDTRTKVSISLARGHISDRDRDQHDAVLVEMERQLTDSQEIAFDNDRSTLSQITDRLDTGADDHRIKARQDLSDLKLPPSSDQHARISALIDDGETVEANELIAQIRTGSSSPHVSPDNQREIFGDFYPKRCEAIQSAIEGLRTPSGVRDAVVSAPAFGGMVLNHLPGGRRNSAQRMLQAWFELKRANGLDDSALRRVTTLFSEMGFIVQQMNAIRSGSNVAEADMQTAPLRTRERCPIPVFGSAADGRYRIVFLWDRPTEEDMLQHADESPRRAATILLYFGRLTKTQREGVAVLARKRLRSILVIDELVLVFLCGERDSRVPVLFACTIPFTYAQPYVTTAGLVPSEMFYGREDEIRQIADPNGSCFIYGGRQLGKTALLRAVERQEHRPTDGRYAIWIDLKGEGVGLDRTAADIWPSIWRALRKLDPEHCPIPDRIKEPNPNVRDRVEKFVDFLTNHFHSSSGRVLLLLLDEADRFLEIDARELGSGTGTGYRESSRLKTLMDQTSRSIKVVFAGLHNVLRTVEYSNHPLGHFGQPIQVGPLWRDAEALIRQPLLASGYRFESDNLVTRILAQTNYYPNLIQLYCSELVKSMCARRIRGGPLYDIDEAVVDETYQSANLRDMIRQRFHMTLQLDPRYEVIAYAIAHESHLQRTVLSNGLDYREIDKITRYWWPKGLEDVEPYTDLFRSLLDEMVGLGVLREADEYRYTLRNPNVLPFMGTADEIENNLLRDRELPQRFQPASFRAHDPRNSDGPSRSPLTYEQEGRLRASKNGVSVVCGLRSAGYDHVLRFLSQREASDSYVELAKSSDHLEFENELDGHLDRRTEGTTIYAVPHKVPWSEKWVQRALENVQRLRSEAKYARVLFMADPSHLFQLLSALDGLTPRGLQWVSMRPWREEFLRQWMEDVGFQDTPDIRSEVMRLTGGWSILLTRLYDLVRDKGSLASGLDHLDRGMTDPHSSQDCLRDFGLDDSVRKKVLLCLAQLGDADFGGLEAVVDDGGIDAGSLRRVLKWAELLHLVRRVEEDSWRPDGVVARLLTSATVEG